MALTLGAIVTVVVDHDGNSAESLELCDEKPHRETKRFLPDW